LILDRQFSDSRFQKFKIPFPFFGAPMVGLSNVAFRELIRGLSSPTNQPILYTEMLSTRRIPGENLKTSFELKTAPNEKLFVPQLLGNEEKYIQDSVRKLNETSPYAFDINMGCPVSHTLKHNWGVRLMGDADYASQVLEYTKKASSVPVSVKLRGSAGEVVDEQFLLSFTKKLEQCGADWITVHPRPKAQKHKGNANWSLVQLVRNSLSIPVIGNGNIQTAQCAISAWETYQPDGVMIARALTARPWIFWQIAELLGDCNLPPNADFLGFTSCPKGEWEEGWAFIKSLQLLLQNLQIYCSSESDILERVVFHVATASPWLEFGHAFWKSCTKQKTVTALSDMLAEFELRVKSKEIEFKMNAKINHL
jgi:tRNA-dihydrouridine synthase B